MYTLIADGGDLTAGRRTASYVYGDWNVSVPDGDEQLKVDERLGDGFIVKINDGKRLGRMDHTFVKEDVSIDMESKTTDLEAVVEDCFGRTSGDLYFQRDVTGVGLNGTAPLRDYNVGDAVRVVRWGKAIPTIVTGIRVSSDKDDRRGFTVHVGGELIKNRRLSNKLSDELRRQVARELVEVRNEVGESNRNARSAITTAGNAYTKATDADTKAADAVETSKDALNRVADAEGEIQGYLTETGELVEQARESARRAKDYLLDIDPKLFEVREAVASAQLLKTAVDERLAGVGTELDAAINASKARIIDPAVREVTDLLQQSTEANREAIRLNNEADGFRDQAIIDLTDASEKLKESQDNLVESASNTATAMEYLKAATESYGLVVKELGTSSEALRKSDDAQNKAITTLDKAVTALDKAQKTETEMRLKAEAAQADMNTRFKKQDSHIQEYFESVQVASEQISLMGNANEYWINRSIGRNQCLVKLTRNGDIITAENMGNCAVMLRVVATWIKGGLITQTTEGTREGGVTIGPGKTKMVLDKNFSGYLHNVFVSSRFVPITPGHVGLSYSPDADIVVIDT